MSSVSRMTAIFESTQPVCVGRFLIDVPKSAEIVFGPARLPVETWRVVGEGKNLHDFVRRAVAKSQEDKWLASDALIGSASMLGKVLDGAGPNHKIVLGVGRADGSFYNVQSFMKAADDLFVQEYQEPGEDNRYLRAVQEAKEVAARLRHRESDEIPQDSGFCLDGAFIADTQSYMVEAVSLGIRLKEFDDVHVSIQTTKKERIVDSDAIEPRLKSAEKSAKETGHGEWYSRIKFLRRGKRNVGKWDGFEVAARMPGHEGRDNSHEFAFLSHGEPKNPLLPVLDVKLQSGVKDNRAGETAPSITDEEAIYLWDRILGSIRPRPVNGAESK